MLNRNRWSKEFNARFDRHLDELKWLYCELYCQLGVSYCHSGSEYRRRPKGLSGTPGSILHSYIPAGQTLQGETIGRPPTAFSKTGVKIKESLGIF